MAQINTKEDWWESAADTIPILPFYASEFGIHFSEEEASKLLKEGKHAELCSMLNKLWNDLPDNRSIRHHPFGDLCDLCSENWVFEEE